MFRECDVLIIGAGPGGSSVARACALAGLDTIFIDKRYEIGYPIRCAEEIGNYLFPFLPFKIPQEQLIWKTEGIEFWAEDITLRRSGVLWSGYTVNRREFDKWVAKQATDVGAKLMLNSELVDFEFREKHVVETAIIKMSKGYVKIKPKVVVGADGFDSTTLKLLGEYHPKKGATAEIYAWEMKGMDLVSQKYGQVFVGDFTETGYAYVFPISKTRANVGVGCAFPKKDMEEYFNEFLEIPKMRQQVKNAVRVDDKSGKAHALPSCEKWVYGNVILVGDTANQNFKPFVEGILPAIICGDVAGGVITKYLRGDGKIEDYPREVERRIGPFFTQSNKTAKRIYELFEMNEPKEYLLLLLLLADVVTPEKIEELEKADYNSLRDMILEWNNWHKQKIANVQEYLWYRYVEIERWIHKRI